MTSMRFSIFFVFTLVGYGCFEGSPGIPTRVARPGTYEPSLNPHAIQADSQIFFSFNSSNSDKSGSNIGTQVDHQDLQISLAEPSESEFASPRGLNEVNGNLCFDNESDCRLATDEVRFVVGNAPTLISKFSLKVEGAVADVKMKGWSFVSANLNFNPVSGVAQYSNIKNKTFSGPNPGSCDLDTTYEISSLDEPDIMYNSYKAIGFDGCDYNYVTKTCDKKPSEIEALSGIYLYEEGDPVQVGTLAGGDLRRAIGDSYANAFRVWPIGLAGTFDGEGLFSFNLVGNRQNYIDGGRINYDDVNSGVLLVDPPFGDDPDNRVGDPNKVILAFCLQGYKVHTTSSSERSAFCVAGKVNPSVRCTNFQNKVDWQKSAKPLYWKSIFKSVRPVMRSF